jgi:multidrug efflux pump subunit AcrB
MSASKKPNDVVPQDKLLPRLTMFFFRRTRATAMLWLLVTLFGIMSYTVLLKREGFPSIAIPIVIVNGSYAVNSPEAVDVKLAKPVSQIALKQPDVQSVQTTSEGNFFSAVVMYKETVDVAKSKADLQKAVGQQLQLPANTKLDFSAPYFGVTGGSKEKVDATISLYSDNQKASVQQLTAKANEAVAYLNKQNLTKVDKFFVSSPFQTVTNPANGQEQTIQRTFDSYGTRESGQTKFASSVIIGVSGVKGADAIKLEDEIKSALGSLQKQQSFKGYHTAVSASNAPTIKDSISELQRVLLEGLLAVLVIGSLIIALRASIITVISMITVLAATIGLLYLTGESLNVITLFSLILGLSLIVDDTIIMVEALDASRKREKTATEVVRVATRKISRAMVAATLTAALSFAPLLFVGGILGSFIRAIPITIISALLISLFTALIFIPFFARFLLLGKKQMGEGNVKEIAAGIEHKIATFMARPMLWAKHHRKREFSVGIAAVLIGLAFVAAAGFIFTKVTFNIFPPTKDSNQIAVSLNFPSTATVQSASATAAEVDKKVSQTLGQNFVDASYYGIANAQTATLYVNIIPYGERDVTAPQLVDKVNAALKDVPSVESKAFQVDVGPPSAAFTVNVNAENRQAAERTATALASYLRGRELTRPSGEKAKIVTASVDNTSVYKRDDGKPVLSVSATFDGDDTTTLTTLAQTAVKKEFNAEKLASFGLASGDVSFDLGQEQENQDSFKSLVFAFPIVLLVIYLLLALQFRSLLQPLLIFMAIPYSLFGVTLGLFLTHNAFSFFAMLGFFALIGLSLKNTILLTDYANQSRRAGMAPIDAAVAALSERFRPLVATSLTAIVSLIPLAVTSPFWQGLAVVLIFGLASSTLLVLTVFPYYYLGAEYLRWRVSRRTFLLWLVVNLLVVGLLTWLVSPIAGLIGLLVCNIVIFVTFFSRRRHTQTV